MNHVTVPKIPWLLQGRVDLLVSAFWLSGWRAVRLSLEIKSSSISSP